MISAEDERCVHELADTDEKRFRRLRLMIDRIVGTTINEQHTAFLDCMAWNRNRTSDECFTPGDVIILTGEYRSGAVCKQVSVSLQIQNIYVKGEISDFRYPTYYPNYSVCKKKGKCSSFKKKHKTVHEKKSRYFVYVGNSEKAG